MLREKPRPASEVDAAISRLLASRLISAMPDLAKLVPRDLFVTLAQIVRDGAPLAEWTAIAKTLEGTGFTASALAAWGHCAKLAATPADQISTLEHKAALETTAGMTQAANADRRAIARLQGRRNTEGVLPELDDGELYVQAAHNDPARHLATILSLGDYPLLHDPLRDPLLTKGYFLGRSTTDGRAATDEASFFVLDGDGQPLLQVEADIQGVQQFGCRETGISLFALIPDHPQLAAAQALAMLQIELSAEWFGADHVLFKVRSGENLPAAQQAWIGARHWGGAPILAAWIELSASEDEIERGYRDAHRQSVRWGRNNVRMVKIDTPDAGAIQTYIDVHDGAARTPGMAPEQLAAFLDDGRVTLYIGHYQDRPAVVLVSSRHRSTTYYWASAKLALGNKPLSHIALHTAIIDAKRSGQARFDFGDVTVEDKVRPKMVSIGLYKRGFASHTQPMNYVMVNI